MSRVLIAVSGIWAVSVGGACGSGHDGGSSRYLDLPVERQFDFPVGAPDGRGYFVAQGFGENFHLGEDWNGIRGGDSDLGDPVQATGKGLVVFSGDVGGGWGNTVRIVHHLRNHGRDAVVESVYAHLDDLGVSEGDWVERGQVVGTIGTAHGRYVAHLHFELRAKPDLPIGSGYSSLTAGYLHPSAFIRENQPPEQRDSAR